MFSMWFPLVSLCVCVCARANDLVSVCANDPVSVCTDDPVSVCTDDPSPGQKYISQDS